MIEINNQTRSKIDLTLVKKTAKSFLKYYKLGNKEVSIAFVGDTVIRQLNKTYRQQDRVTDVLAFPSTEKDFLGEIIIDYAQIRRQAEKFSGSTKEELIFILVHGLLHLQGYRDDTGDGKREMQRMGEEFLRNSNL